ncbi:bifunctional hydroxymethylpyrimidine kinase/phosphomethylpyrimidine kinase [Vagococcus fluvialis]|uniref:bifunctional hydroxymethylpyrimidine kinase/phosphomethylpyrimidine kinase n=1 Tax=Vagococcus fluvialis TaxID=2738 RepID=UPI003B5A906F
MKVNSTPQVVTIAGTDSGGGAGVQADLKTFHNRNAFGMSIVVALTAQNTLGVQNAFPVPVEFVTDQFNSLAADFNIKAAKTGMLADEEHVKCVVENLKKVDFGPLVVDPVMIAKGGHALLSEDAIDTIKNDLLPLAFIVTPNLPETEVIVGYPVETESDMMRAAVDLKEMGVKHVIVKGGHLENKLARDYVLLDSGESFWLSSSRINTIKTHGTGDTFSSCIAAELAKGTEVKEAIIIGKKFIQGAIKEELFVGHGHGPTNHWAELDESIEISY